MTDYGTIKIPKDEYDHHNEQRKEMNLTWAEYINGESPNLPNASEGLDEEALLNDVIGRIDDLESRLPRKVAEELR
jgi:hypothetical protein